MKIPVHSLPLRQYQIELKEAYNNPLIDEILAIIARRGGKTTTLFKECVAPDLVKEKQTIVFVYPIAFMLDPLRLMRSIKRGRPLKNWKKPTTIASDLPRSQTVNTGYALL